LRCAARLLLLRLLLVLVLVCHALALQVCTHLLQAQHGLGLLL
jgi:hypothetical protein